MVFFFLCIEVVHEVQRLDEEIECRDFLNKVATKTSPAKWEALGSELGLTPTETSGIAMEEKKGDILFYFRRVFEVWSRKDTSHTWRDIINALNADQVREKRLANELERELIEQ